MAESGKRSRRKSCLFIVFILFGMPLLFLGIIELTIRILHLDVDAIKDKNIQISLPVWLMEDDRWIDFNKNRLKEKEGIPADSVSWLLHFQEARYFLYKIKPNIEARILNHFCPVGGKDEISFTIHSNSWGFRGPEFKRKKGKNVFRIVCLGDSSTFGWGVESQYMFSSLLSKKLNEEQNGQSFEVINLGLPGFTSYHGIMVFKHLAASLSPDLIIVSFGANDPRYVRYSLKDLLDREETMVGAARSFLRNFKTYMLMRRLILKVYDPLSPEKLDQRPQQQALSRRAVTLNEFEENLEFFITASQSIGAQTMLLSVCSPLKYIETVGNVAERYQVPFIDVQKLLFDHYDKIVNKEIYSAVVSYYERVYTKEELQQHKMLYITVDGCHPNIIGHDLLTKEIFRKLLEYNIIESKKNNSQPLK